MSKPRLVKRGEADTGLAAPSAQAIQFGGISLGASGVVFTGKPDFGDYVAALNTAAYLDEHAGFWLADLLEYGYKRADWEGVIDSVIDAGRFTESTVKKYRYLARNVPPADRVDGLSLAHHAVVAALPSADKRQHLTAAKRDHLSVSALAAEVRKAAKVIQITSGQAGALARAFDEVASWAHDAKTACGEIALADAADAEAKIAAARQALSACEIALKALRKIQGRT